MNPWVPDSLPVENLDKEALITLIGQSNAEISRYDGLLHGVVNPNVMLSPLTQREAVLSSKIEGTQATVEEVLEHEAGQKYDPEKTADIQEILNYRQALNLATEHVKERPINLTLVKALHRVLMDSVRGHNKEPGEFRKIQNWIGKKNCKIEDASFVPPSPLQLQDHLEAWEQYMGGEDFDPIVQAAVVHAQFEILHPFKDGNGRIGRLLIPLFLYSKGALNSPVFYLSDYLESNRSEYYTRLREITDSGDWTGWVKFFLEAVVEQARENTNRIKEIMDLYEYTKVRVPDITHSQYSSQIVDYIFERPIFRASGLIKRLGIARPTVHAIISKLTDQGVIIIIRPSSGRRAATYAFPDLINIAEGEKLF